jgi:septum formation protein
MLSQKFKNTNVILASGSPRRQELFKELGLHFSIKVKQVDEIYASNLKASEITEYLAVLKASAFDNELNDTDLIITSDTIVWHNNKALEKPKDKEDAIAMLLKLSDSNHEVITSVCLKTKFKKVVFSDITKVYFNKLTIEEINYYVENYRPFDKAGAYGIQEWIGFIGVEKIVGSYFNVMGFPVHKLYQELLKF